MQTSLTHVDNDPNSRFEVNIFKPIFHTVIYNIIYVSLVIIDFSFVEKTSQIYLTHKILFLSLKKLDWIFINYQF